MRPSLKQRVPLHVTLRMVAGVHSLREPRAFKVIESALREGALRFETRIVHFSVMENHLHMLVETRDREQLSRAMKGLGVRIARRLNAATRRRGQVIGERYHVRPLRTPTEVKNALHYVLHNRRHHLLERGVRLHHDWVDPCSSSAIKDRLPLPGPETWLLSEGWERGGPRRKLRRGPEG